MIVPAGSTVRMEGVGMDSDADSERDSIADVALADLDGYESSESGSAEAERSRRRFDPNNILEIAMASCHTLQRIDGVVYGNMVEKEIWDGNGPNRKILVSDQF